MALPPGSTRVLVVEHDPIQADATVDVLRRAGFDALAPMRDAREGLDGVARLRPHVVLLEAGVTGQHGAAADAFARAGVAVVLMSSPEGAEALQQEEAGRRHGILVKPLRPPDVRAAIELALQGEVGQEPAVLSYADAILDASPDPVVAVDQGGRVRHVNAAFCAWAGTSGEDAVGQPLAQLLEVEARGSASILQSFIQRTLAVRAPIRLPRRTTVRTRNGPLPVAGVATPLGRPVGGVLIALRELRREKQMGSLEADALSMATRLEAAAGVAQA